jgi:hypothetical protein
MLWFWLVLAAAAAAGGIGFQRQEKRRNAGYRARGPATDLSPFTAALLSGHKVAAYTAAVRATTPDGIAVTQGRCCPRGHQSPAQAVAHAGRISQRITSTGR